MTRPGWAALGLLWALTAALGAQGLSLPGPGANSGAGLLGGPGAPGGGPGGLNPAGFPASGPEPGLALTFAPDPAAPHRGQLVWTFTIPEGLYQDPDPVFFGLEVLAPWAAEGAPVFPPTVRRLDKDSYQGSVVVTQAVVWAGEGPPNTPPQARVRWQICTVDGLCYFPQTRELSSGGPPGSVVTGPGSEAESLAWPLWLLLGLLGGLLLNVMPCVFPLLSVKALALVKASQRSGRDQRLLALWYTLGILAALSLVGIAFWALKAAGQAVGWGLFLQHPPTLAALIAVLWVFALSLWGVWEFGALGGRFDLDQPLGSFLSGLFAVGAAAPCTAPFLGPALAWALSGPEWLILPQFWMVGLGFAAPYTVLAFWPGLAKRLPKPGPWMDSFKGLLGWALAGWALYLVTTLGALTGPDTQGRLWLWAFAGSLALWVWGRWGLRLGRLARALSLGALVLVLVGGWVWAFPPGAARDSASGLLDGADKGPGQGLGPAPGSVKTLRPGWEAFSLEALSAALASGAPVFVDVRADWCTNCKVNEALVLHTELIEGLMAAQGVRRFVADYTRADPAIAAYLAALQRFGLPVYAWYPPAAPGQDPAARRPEFWPELLWPDFVAGRLTGP